MSTIKFAYLVAYAITCCLITANSFIKRRSAISSLLWLLYAVSAVACVLCKLFQGELVGIGIMHELWYDLSDTTLWGYVLIIVCNCIAFRAIDKFCAEMDIGSIGKTEAEKQYLMLFCGVYLSMGIVFLLLSAGTVRMLLSNSDYGAIRSSLYGNAENESNFVMTYNPVANLFYKLCLQLKYLNVFIAIILLKERRGRKVAAGSLVVSFIIYYLYAMGNAARGGLLIFAFCSYLIYTTMLDYLSDGTKRRLRLFIIICLGVVVSFFFSVTISRFGNDMGAGNPIVRNIAFYLGHGPIEFSKLTGSLQHLAYGKAVLGRLANHYFGTPYSWESVQFNIGYPPIGAVFTTYLGFLYTDFGAAGCILFVTLWSGIMVAAIRGGRDRISTLFLFGYYLSYFVTGAFAIGRLEYASMITSLAIFLCIRLAEDATKYRARVSVEQLDSNGRLSHGKGYY
jgi:oligosaccharide repeat unit polymerase